MATEIVSLAREHLAAVARFSERTWRRPRSADYLRWRYLESPLQRGWLVLRDGGECLAMLIAFARAYRCDGELVTFLEVHDWFALPELKGAGPGVRLIQHAMRQPEPLLMVGGTEDSHRLMPRLGFQVPATAEHWVLPVAGAAFGAALERRARVPAALGAAAFRAGAGLWFRARRRGAPPGGRVVPVARPGAELAALYARRSPYRTVPQWSEAHLAWLMAGFAGAGHFVPLYFEVHGEWVGWALLRVVAAETGCEASLVTVFAPEPDLGLYTWMVSEAAAIAAAFRPRWIQTETTCPVLSAALRRNRFLRAGTAPVWVWPKERSLPAPVAIGLDTGDTPLLPYPERWESAPTGEVAR